ncbi:MAG: heme biosynthesis protein [Deltaproteobacteria bacterium RIFOXYD12_FULL_57_12]|nr:MAG: heme biosynthesis protein [Deltaproteobacteria bacterium RIFOXYD12_FULL_57_12]
MRQVAARTVDFRVGERNVFLHVLTACNLACRHCYINPGQHGSSAISRETMAEWLALFAAPDRETNLILLGGEPTLHPDLAFGIRTAREFGYASVTVDTNGFLFHDFLERVSPADLDYLSFSLDGPSAVVNDPIRGAGVFATCTANLCKAVARGFNVSLIYTVSRHNIDFLPQMPALLAEWGVQRFFIQVIGLRGKTAQGQAGDWQLSPEEWLAVVPAVARRAAELGVVAVFPKVFLASDEDFSCAGRVAENYFVFPNGRVYVCPLCEDYPINAFRIEAGQLVRNSGLTEERFFSLDIPEGCVMSRLLQPANLGHSPDGRPLHRISCCLLKQEMKRS